MITTVWDAPDYTLPHYWSIRGNSLERIMNCFGDGGPLVDTVRGGVARDEDGIRVTVRHAVRPDDPRHAGVPVAHADRAARA